MVKYYSWAMPFVRIANAGLTLVSITALWLLVATYGFYLPSGIEELINRFDLGIVQFYVLYYVAKFLLCDTKKRFVQTHAMETMLVAAIAVLIFVIAKNSGLGSVFPYFQDSRETALKGVTLVCTQIIILLTFIPGINHFNPTISNLRFHPSQTIMMSFLAVILLGTFFLMLPKAVVLPNHITFIDALFTATSATCVTGLIVVDTATYFTRFGQLVILILIQIGGLGIMTLTTFLVTFFRHGVGIRERVFLRELVNVDKFDIITGTIRKVVIITFSLELIGAALLFMIWYTPDWSLKQLIYHSVYHSVAAFCNAGFSTFSDSLVSYQRNAGVVFTVCALVILGGLGFSVLSECSVFLFKRSRLKKSLRLSLQTKMVLIVTSILIVAGTVILFLLDYTNKDLWFRFLTALFNSVIARTAGFNTIDIGTLSVSATIILIVLMYIGASPASTGGGIKTTTVGVLWVSLLSIIKGKNRVELFKKNLPYMVLNRALVVVAFSAVLIIVSVFFLSITENALFIDILFEEVSAFGTVGLSRGLTSHLSEAGKCIITFSMFFGRLGALTMAFAITAPKSSRARVEYPSESVVIG